MSSCPFLSSHLKNVSCFKECAFYEHIEINSICPFRVHRKDKLQELSSFYEYDIFSNENSQLLEDIYEDNSYYKIFNIKSIV